jgi:hypothetical protein
LNVGNVTDYTLTGLTERGGYYIAVTAYDKSGNESVYSNEVSGAAREPTQTYTVATNPPGLQVTVDGAPHTASKKFSWIPGTSHTLSVESPQSGSAGVRYVFAYWSDGGDQGHTMIAPSSNTAFMVTFNVQWAEDTSGSQNPIVISVNGNKDIGVNFDLAMETVSTPNGPSGSREGTTGMSYLFETGGSTSSFGDPVQYLFDWGGCRDNHCIPFVEHTGRLSGEISSPMLQPSLCRFKLVGTDDDGGRASPDNDRCHRLSC